MWKLSRKSARLWSLKEEAHISSLTLLLVSRCGLWALWVRAMTSAPSSGSTCLWSWWTASSCTKSWHTCEWRQQNGRIWCFIGSGHRRKFFIGIFVHWSPEFMSELIHGFRHVSCLGATTSWLASFRLLQPDVPFKFKSRTKDGYHWASALPLSALHWTRGHTVDLVYSQFKTVEYTQSNSGVICS